MFGIFNKANRVSERQKTRRLTGDERRREVVIVDAAGHGHGAQGPRSVSGPVVEIDEWTYEIWFNAPKTGYQSRYSNEDFQRALDEPIPIDMVEVYDGETFVFVPKSDLMKSSRSRSLQQQTRGLG